jgi:hypothetical protein
VTDIEPPTLAAEPLAYAHELPGLPPRRIAKLALALSLVAPACLVVSIAMFWLMDHTGVGWGPLRGVQVTLAWAAIGLGGVAVVVSTIAMIRRPRGGREIAALTAAIVNAALVLAAFKYL